jgi:hypothetical protein
MTELKVEDIKPGMYIKVSQKIKDGDKEKNATYRGVSNSKKAWQRVRCYHYYKKSNGWSRCGMDIASFFSKNKKD